MIKIIHNQFYRSYDESVRLCRESVINMLVKSQKAVLLDCGCNDGSFTEELAEKVGTKNVYGLEISEAAKDAEKKGIKVSSADLNNKLPYKDNFFDVIVANQVIEHLSNTDGFIKEIRRCLKPGGYAVISTNNLSSWHNIVALFLGRQPFPSDVSNFTHIGKLTKMWGDGDAGSWSHLRIFTLHSLVKIFEFYKFKMESVKGIGYYPFSGWLAMRLSNLDRLHTAYVTIKVSK